jgi:xylobiose transport system substrate-binding protein
MSSPSFRRGVLGVALAGLLVAGSAACGSSGPSGSAGSTDTVHVWVLQNQSLNNVEKSAADEYNKTSKVKVAVDVYGPDVYRDKLRAAMGSPNSPDAFFNWGGGSIASYVDAGQLVDLTPAMSQDAQFKSSFLPAVLNAGKINDKYYGVPLRGMQPVILFYNKAALAKVNAQPPATWNDLLTLVDKLKAAKITPFALGGADAWTELMYLEYLVDRYGGAGAFANIVAGKPGAWDDPNVLKAAQAIRTLVDRGAFGTNYASVSYSQGAASTVFARGRAAMHLMGSWEFTNQVQQEPSFAKSGLGYTTFPSVEGGLGDASSVVGNPTNYFSISNKTKHQDAVVNFLKLMSSDKYVTDLVKIGDVPTTTNAEAKLSQSPSPDFSTYQFQLVQKAASFTLSWDQAMTPEGGQTVNTALQKLFNKQFSPAQFIAAVKETK